MTMSYCFSLSVSAYVSFMLTYKVEFLKELSYYAEFRTITEIYTFSIFLKQIYYLSKNIASQPR